MMLRGILPMFVCFGAFCACQYTTGRRMSEAEIRELLQIGSQGIKGLPLETVDVQLKFDLTGVTELNEEQGYVETNGWLMVFWNDPRLAYPGVQMSSNNIRVRPGDIWTPDIALYNAASTGYKILNRDLLEAVVSYNGSVLLAEDASVRSSCDILGQLTNGDTVTCSLKFGSWASHAGLIDVHLMSTDATNRDGPRELRLSEFRPAGRWTATGASQQRDVLRYDCCPEQYALTTFNFTFQKRRLG